MTDAGFSTKGVDGVFGSNSLKAIEAMLAKIGHAPKPTVKQNELAWVAKRS